MLAPAPAAAAGVAPAAPAPATVAGLEDSVQIAALERAQAVIADLPVTGGTQPSTAADLKRLHALAAELELAGGPANVAAARDVHTLQVAFEPPITQLIDKHVVAATGKLETLQARLLTERSITLPALPKQPSRVAFTHYLAQARQLLAVNATELPPLLVRRKYTGLTAQMWAMLSDEARDVLVQTTAADHSPPERRLGTSAIARSGERGPDDANTRDHRPRVRDHRGEFGTDPSSEIDALLESSPSVIGEADQTLADLLDRLRGNYEFTVYVPDRSDHGLLLTYRQEWSPVRYQVGRLVDTLPLAPGKRREFKVTTTRRTRDARKSVTTTARETDTDTARTSRFESEAIDAATTAINNQLSSKGDFNIGVGSIGGSAQFTQDLRSESRRTLKNFSEMARKAVDRLKEQVEVTVEDTTELTDETGYVRAIENPNNELTVTDLLYELERRYRVETRLQQVRPVILVALPVPSPDEITIAWILEHSWVIREALLDPTLAGVLDTLEETQSGAAIEYEVRRRARRCSTSAGSPRGS